jgi:hypothetical protein
MSEVEVQADGSVIEEKVAQLAAEGKLGFVPMKSVKATKLPPIPYDWTHIMQLCARRQFSSNSDEAAFIVLPVAEHMDTKKNRARLLQEDSTSPMGVIDKNDGFARLAYQPFASAKFKTAEIMRWLVVSGKVVDEQDTSLS